MPPGPRRGPPILFEPPPTTPFVETVAGHQPDAGRKAKSMVDIAINVADAAVADSRWANVPKVPKDDPRRVRN